MVYLCADPHGLDYIGKVQEFFAKKTERVELHKEVDYLIILGDVAVCWDNGSMDETVKNFYQDLPLTTLFLDGNHENFNILDSIPEEEWHGGMVQFIAPDIIHLMRGNVYEIDGHSYFVFGGACSYNKSELMDGISWWQQEMPTIEEYNYGWENLKLHNYKVDYMLSHAGPYEVLGEMGFGCYEEALELARMLQRFADNTDFEEYYFGHFHIDEDVEQYHCLMEEIVTIK